MKKNYLKTMALALGLLGWSATTNAQFSESFEGAGTPVGWTVLDNDGQGNTWSFQAPSDAGSVQDGTQVCDIEYETSAHDDYLITPQIAVVDGSTDQLRFYSRNRSSTFQEQFNVLISTAGNTAADFTTTLAGPLSPSTGSWDELVYDLSVYEGQNIYIAFQAISTNEFSLYIDDVNIEAVPTCPAPTALTVFNLAGFSTDLTWTENGSASSWQIEYDTLGFTQGTGTLSVVGNDTTTISSLTPETDYEFYVRAICGPGDSSVWVGPIAFTTTPSCPAPTALNFTNPTATTTDLTWAQAGSPASWQMEYGTTGFTQGTGTISLESNDTATVATTLNADYDFYVRAICGAGDTSTWAGPFTFHTGYCTSIPTSHDNNGISNIMVGTTNFAGSSIEYLDFTGGTIVDLAQSIQANLQITFETGYTYGTNVWIDLNDNFVFESTELAFSGTSANTNPTTLDASFPMLATAPLGNHYMRIGTADGGQSTPNPCYSGGYGVTADFIINVIAAPACLPVTALTTTNIYSDSAQIGWTLGGTETAWNIEWGAPGFTPGTNTELGSSSLPTNSYMITGLAPNTNYDVYVQANCGTDSSTWVGALSVTTLCLPETVPYVEDFTSGAMSNCWTTSDATNVYVEPSCGTRTNILRFDQSNNAITNDIDASAVSNSVKVSYYIAESVCGNVADQGETFEVSYWDGTQYVVAKTYDAERPDEYTREFFIVPASALTSNFKVKFEQMQGTTDTWMIDSLVVEQGPSCLPVTALTASNIYPDSAQVTWTPMGLETAWNIEWGAPGFTPGTNTELGSSSLPTSSYMITGLSPNTNYDVYVQANCGSDSSFWIGPLSIFTGHCIVNSTNTNYGIGNFTTTNGIVNINNTTGPGTYEDYTNMSVKQYIGGTDVAFSITSVQSTTGMGIWVDWNNNLIWDATEQVYNSGGYTANGTGTIAIPVGTPVGDYRMRVVANYLSSNPIPCDDLGNAGYGEAEDYTFSVILQPSCMPVNTASIVNEYADSIQISWTAGGVETTWNIEWGTPGFTPGTGTAIGADTTLTTSYTVTGLTPSTTYDIYIQANCGSDSSFWILVQGTTLCAPITTLPWTENFDAMPTIGNNIFPLCWLTQYGNWYSDDATFSGVTPLSAPNVASISYGDDDYLWTPKFNLTAGTTYEFAFHWIGDGYNGWTGEVFASGTQSSLDAIQIGVPFITDGVNTDDTQFKKEIYCFTPDTSGAFSFGVHVSANFNPFHISFDNFSVRIPNPSAGSNGATTICQTGGNIDLNAVITITDTTGNWMFAPNPTAIVSDTLFNPSSIAAGMQSIYYVVGGCVPDTAIAEVTIYPPSSAGTNGTDTTCNYGFYNLYNALTGSADLGGQWYDPASQPINGSSVNFSGNIPASYNYIYIASNGVCPADTAIVEIVLTQCAGVDEYSLQGFNFYPNPTNGVVNIQYSGKGEDVQIDIIDTKGAVVWTKQVLFNDGSAQKIDLTRFENGTYYINMRSKNGAKVMKVVKN